MSFRRTVGVNPSTHLVATRLDVTDIPCRGNWLTFDKVRCRRLPRVEVGAGKWPVCVFHARQLGYEIPPGIELENGGAP